MTSSPKRCPTCNCVGELDCGEAAVMARDKTGAAMIAAERTRQVEAKGYTPEIDRLLAKDG